MSYAYLLPYEDKALPRSLRMYGASDYATMEVQQGKREPDFTEHGVWGVDQVGDLWAVSISIARCFSTTIQKFPGAMRENSPRLR